MSRETRRDDEAESVCAHCHDQADACVKLSAERDALHEALVRVYERVTEQLAQPVEHDGEALVAIATMIEAATSSNAVATPVESATPVPSRKKGLAPERDALRGEK